MDVKEIKRLLDAIAATEVSELSYETGDFKLQVKRGRAVLEAVSGTTVERAAAEMAPQAVANPNPPTPATPAETTAATSHLIEVTAPIVGTFYSASAPEAEPYAKVGDRVQAGTVLCIIEAMKLMNEIEAESSGTIAEVLVRNEEPVEFGQVLFRIEPL